MVPYRNEEEKEKALFSLAAEMGLLEITEHLTGDLLPPKRADLPVSPTDTLRLSVREDFSRLT
jgi:hypothetical protein